MGHIYITMDIRRCIIYNIIRVWRVPNICLKTQNNVIQNKKNTTKPSKYKNLKIKLCCQGTFSLKFDSLFEYRLDCLLYSILAFIKFPPSF